MLEELVDSYLSSLAGEARVRSVSYLHTLPRHTATVGTACSGTDVPLLALLAIQHVVCRKYKLPVRFLHLFSAELDKRKRTFCSVCTRARSSACSVIAPRCMI